MRLGFVGVGAISAAMVEAICTGPRAGAYEFVLSPRNARRAADLADRFPEVSVAVSNQAVVDASDIVFLGVLPPQAEQVCGELTFRAEQIVASLVAGLPPSKVAALVAPATQVCQMIPMPPIVLHVGPIVISPALTPVVDVFEGCGDIIEIADESQIRILSCASATMSSFLQFEKTAIDWAVKAGIEYSVARDYMASLYTSLAVETAHAPLEHVATMPQEHETPGGLNEYLRTSLVGAGMYDAMTQGLDYLMYHKNLAKPAAQSKD